jgi:hypothetical protein
MPHLLSSSSRMLTTSGSPGIAIPKRILDAASLVLRLSSTNWCPSIPLMSVASPFGAFSITQSIATCGVSDDSGLLRGASSV